MRILAIDAGNTRLKWGLSDGTTWLSRDVLPRLRDIDAQAKFATLLATSLAPVLAPKKIVVSNVAGDVVGRAIEGVLAKRYPGVQPHWVVSQLAQGGVLNAYDVAHQLGCDRWASLIAAHHMHDGDCLVVHAGTAVTIDALSSDGRFLGGLILPSFRLMRETLAANTAQLTLDRGAFTDFPCNTVDAVTTGCEAAILGAIERQARIFAPKKNFVCLIGGGGAEELASRLNMKTRLVDNLVLEGLVYISKESAGRRTGV